MEVLEVVANGLVTVGDFFGELFTETNNFLSSVPEYMEYVGTYVSALPAYFIVPVGAIIAVGLANKIYSLF